MNSIQKKQLAILEDAANFYNLGNRGRSTTGCVYLNPETGNRCAIGRNVSLRTAKKLAKCGSGMCDEIFVLLPKKLQILGFGFLKTLQDLHDERINWTEEGLSEQGKGRVEYIKIAYGLNEK